MTMKEKIAPYVEQGLNASQIHRLHPDWNYRTIYAAMHPEMNKKSKKKKPDPVERPKGWNADKKACKSCKYRSGGVTAMGGNGCNFILIEGHSRGTKIADCNRYIKGRRIQLRAYGRRGQEEGEFDYDSGTCY